MKTKVRLGYACINTALRKRHIFSSRTAREGTIKDKGVSFAKELFAQNLDDTLKILQWNERRGIKLFRISSDLAPHLSNPTFIPKKHWKNMKKLAYDLRPFEAKLRAIGDYAKAHGHRLTFHPGQFVVIGTPREDVFVRSGRELYMHALIFDMMGLDYNSIMVVHGGGVYCDKAGTMLRWGRNFARLPIEVKRRLVLENDETCYSIADILQLSASLPKFPGCSKKYKLPIVFDIFHYECYNSTITRRNVVARECLARSLKRGEDFCDAPLAKPQKPISAFLPSIIESWGKRRIKMHLSEQGRSKVLGKHSYRIETIPKWVLTFPRKYKRGLDLMIEAKGKEVAVVALRKKYGSRVA